jgi:S-methylmethionine-dependent homocysteine/selenocysteine methylase
LTFTRINIIEIQNLNVFLLKEQIEWAAEAGVDYIIGETFSDLGEAMLALKAIQKYGKGCSFKCRKCMAGLYRKIKFIDEMENY